MIDMTKKMFVENLMRMELCEKYLNKRVIIKDISKPTYEKYNLIGDGGTVKNTSCDQIGVLVDNKYNSASESGLFWFKEDEIDFLENESEDINMGNFEYVAIVNILEDSYKRDYAFALYEKDFELIQNMERNVHALVVVNARAKDNRILGTIKSIVDAKEYFNENNNVNITAEVVGVVNMDRYIMDEEEKVRLKELAKKKAAIEKELEAEINKRKSVEYYEEMAKKYSDNPKLTELVAELRSLGV